MGIRQDFFASRGGRAPYSILKFAMKLFIGGSIIFLLYSLLPFEAESKEAKGPNSIVLSKISCFKVETSPEEMVLVEGLFMEKNLPMKTSSSSIPVPDGCPWPM